MSLLKKLALRIAVIRARKEAESMFGEDWRGKLGAVGVMVTGACTLLYGIACMLGEVTAIPVTGVPCPPEGCSMPVCVGMLVVGFGVFKGGLSQYGTRRAIGRVEQAIAKIEEKVTKEGSAA